jgi:chaperonin cofactor prefoldin
MKVDRLESRDDQLEIHVAVLEKKVDVMDRRLERVAAHLRLAGAPPEGGA